LITAVESTKRMINSNPQEEEEKDIEAMSTSDDNASNVDEDEEIFQGNVQMFQQELDAASPKQVETVINATFEAQEIVPIREKTNAERVIGWSMRTKTERSEAVIAWLQKNKFAHLHQSNSIADHRPSQLPFGKYITQQAKDQLNI
jgi:metal-dependent amidase/aminoacylase/carboxypeptidase family protein